MTPAEKALLKKEIYEEIREEMGLRSGVHAMSGTTVYIILDESFKKLIERAQREYLLAE